MSGITVHHLQVGQGERIPWLLEELGVPYQLKKHKRSPIFSPPELQALHPMGAAPVIEDATFDKENALVLAESGAIAEYLIHKHGNGRLALPPSHKDYADYLYWFHFSNSTLQPALFRRALVRGMSSGEDDPRYKGVEERTKRTLGHVENRVANNTYLAGEEFTAADVMTVWSFTTMRKFEPIDLTEYPGIHKWIKTCTDRPAYRTAMQKGDPDLNVEELISVKGPERFAGAFGAPANK
ncbi:glutathione S-transferase [Pleomassaria siparia CBS 279.74]|uniref:Glutathione S-transferase n=1 Tax=Pleomassaria siparia CBS 279.74 TaxID=1314801 RepID=A0A6G1JRB7_9PLEO|nr:glutathione S-transferase [Pleomassaria siparia CBS 279.74]